MKDWLFFLGVFLVAVACAYWWVMTLLQDDEPVISQADRDEVERERQEFDRRRAQLDIASRLKAKR